MKTLSVLSLLCLLPTQAVLAGECEEIKVELARHHLAVYLDPSGATRKIRTRRSVALLQDANTDDPSRCTTDLVFTIAQFAIASSYRGTPFEEALNVVRSRHIASQMTDPELAEQLVTQCKSGAANPCSQWQLAYIAWSKPLDKLSLDRSAFLQQFNGDPELKKAVVLWQDYLQNGSRADAARHGLSAEWNTQLGTRTREYLVQWSLTELLPADPRSWSPADVAEVVRVARRIDGDQTFRAFPKERVDRLFAPLDRPVDEAELQNANSTVAAELGVAARRASLQRYLEALSAMGFVRALELLQPTSMNLPGVTEPGTLSQFLTSSGRWEHFPNEFLLYKHNWHEATRIDLAKLSIEDRAEAYRKRAEYVAQRWLETDRAAPAPDLDAVRIILKQSEQGGGTKLTPNER